MRMKQKAGWRKFGLPGFIGFCLVRAVAAGEGPPSLTTVEVVEKMVAMNALRAQALRSYTVTRLYHVENRKRKANLVATMTYQSPDKKDFKIVSQSGSGVLQKLVLKRAIESEQEAARTEAGKASAIHPDNYDFNLIGSEQEAERQLYVLTADPKVNNKFCIRGRIWVDCQDFAIVRVEGQPAKNPSWWLKRVEIRQNYKPVGDFWLPERNESRSQVRIFGPSSLTIDYTDYQLLEVDPLLP